jgi:hypothetical protein
LGLQITVYYPTVLAANLNKVRNFSACQVCGSLPLSKHVSILRQPCWISSLEDVATLCNRPRYLAQSFSHDKHNFVYTVLTPNAVNNTSNRLYQTLTNLHTHTYACDRFQVLTAVPIKTALFRDANQCIPTWAFRRFDIMYYCHVQIIIPP